MKQPPFEVADIIRKAGTRFIERYRESLGWAQLKVLTAKRNDHGFRLHAAQLRDAIAVQTGAVDQEAGFE